MRNSSAYYLLIIYIVAICKPAFPVIQDTLAHTLWRAHHFATVHQHHGDRHVSEEIAAVLTENDDKGSHETKPEMPVSLHILPEEPLLLVSVSKAGDGIFLLHGFQRPCFDICAPPPDRHCL